MPPIVLLRNLTKTYPMGEHPLPVLKDINMTINPGDYFLAGENVAQLPDDDLSYHRNLHIGFIFQSFNLFPQLDVAGNIAVPMMYGRSPLRQRRRRAKELAELVGLGHR